ncbi:hypothetical protein BTI_2931 [Burkholderia thailandensis MSMB121]|nr:hypothetical protein BTI_2931 [Burkholderia thailandensis MSMB121]
MRENRTCTRLPGYPDPAAVWRAQAAWSTPT